MGVGPAVAIAIFEDRDGVVGDLARFDLRIHARRRHPQPALRIKVHLQRLRDQRISREQVHLVALRHLHRRQLRSRIGIGNVLEPALGKRRPQARHHQEDSDESESEVHA